VRFAPHLQPLLRPMAHPPAGLLFFTLSLALLAHSPTHPLAHSPAQGRSRLEGKPAVGPRKVLGVWQQLIECSQVMPQLPLESQMGAV
jgi:hypothetical protein